MSESNPATNPAILVNTFINITENPRKNIMAFLGAYPMITYVFVILGIIAILFILKGGDGNCPNTTLDTQMEKIYTNEKYTSKIGGINDSSKYKHALCNYYVAGSYNSCCSGNFKNTCVSTKPLKTVILSGARVLDFEIFSINKIPVVAVSNSDNVNLKGSYNFLTLDEVFKVINDCAFDAIHCPNPRDPLFLNFRIKSNRNDIYNKLATSIDTSFAGKLLPTKWAHGGTNSKERLRNIGLNELMDKVVIMAAQDGDNYKDSNNSFYEVINFSAGEGGFRTKKSTDVETPYSEEDLIDENKTSQTVTVPGWSIINGNSKAKTHHENGCQMVLMNYQNLDSNMQYYINYFNSNGSAFVLKPSSKRHVPITKNTLKKTPPEWKIKPGDDKITVTTDKGTMILG
jgi:hypothetical protein